MRLALLVVFAVCAYGQPKPVFEVASIKPSSSADNFYSNLKAGQFAARSYPVSMLIQTAFSLGPLRVQGLPAWTNSARFDIQAQASDRGVADDQVRLMLQSMLEERFRLKFHRETREQSVYVVSVADKTKIVPAGTAENSTLAPGRLRLPKGSMKELITLLQVELERPVVDRTGLTTNFTILLDYASRLIPGDDKSSQPSLVTALREQLGLKIESTRVPAEMFVVDSVQRPTEN